MNERKLGIYTKREEFEITAAIIVLFLIAIAVCTLIIGVKGMLFGFSFALLIFSIKLFSHE